MTLSTNRSDKLQKFTHIFPEFKRGLPLQRQEISCGYQSSVGSTMRHTNVRQKQLPVKRCS